MADLKAEPDFAAMAKELSVLLDEEKYGAFLRRQSLAGYHSFLYAAIKRSNLRPSVRKVLEELLTGKLRRVKHRPRTDDADIKGAYRALRVLDLEDAGCVGHKRDAAIREAGKQLHCSYSTVEKALHKYEDLLKGADAELLEYLRSAFK